MKAREIITRLVRAGLTPVLRPANFTSSGLTFHRRREAAVEVINVQLSQSNFGEHGHFYINVGLNFDDICRIEGKPVLAKPKVYMCQFQRRLGRLIPDVPERWEVTTPNDADRLAPALRDRCEQLLMALDKIESVESFLAHSWLNGGADLGLRAQMQYVLGNREAAIDALQQLHAAFQDRPYWNLDYWLESLGLESLKPELYL